MTSAAAPPETVAGTRAVLLGAARVLEQVGMCQRQGMDLTGRVCVVTALHIAADDDDWYVAESAAQALEVWLFGPSRRGSLTRWNDEPERTTDHVVAALRAAAAALEPAPPAMTPDSPAARS